MLLGVDLQAGATDEAEAGVIEVVVGPIVDVAVLRDRAVPDVQVEREERAPCRCACPMAEVVLANLAMIVGKTVGISLRFGKQAAGASSRRCKKPTKTTFAGWKYPDLADIVTPVTLAVGAGGNAGDLGSVEDLQVFRFESFGNGGDGSGIFGADVAPPRIAVAMKGAAGRPLYGWELMAAGPRKGFQPSLRAVRPSVSVKSVPRSGGMGYSRWRGPSKTLPARIDLP